MLPILLLKVLGVPNLRVGRSPLNLERKTDLGKAVIAVKFQPILTKVPIFFSISSFFNDIMTV